jgi:hypothetical protein
MNDPLSEMGRQIAMLGAATLGILFAFIGDMVRLLHLQERGGAKLTWRSVPGSALRGLLMGVIATATAAYLRDAYGFPELAGGAIGGVLGYLGPTMLSVSFNGLVQRYASAPKPKDPPSDA